MIRVLVPLADGFEEMEAVIAIDVLRRAGAAVTMLGLPGRRVRGSHEIVVEADSDDPALLRESWDAVVLPGGMPGSETLAADPRILALLARQVREGRVAAAICAAPLALERAGLLAGRRATSHPSVRGRLAPAEYLEEPVVEDGPVVTSRGAGTAFAFALALAARLAGRAAADRIAAGMVCVNRP